MSIAAIHLVEQNIRDVEAAKQLRLRDFLLNNQWKAET
jgi:hypothetical protein